MGAIDERFADWYRPAAIDLTTAPLKQRWEAVMALTKALSIAHLPTAVLLAFGRTVKEDEGIPIRQALKKADASLPIRDNDLELSILTGTALMLMLQPAGPLAIPAALCVRLAGIHDWDPAVPELPSAASNFLLSAGRQARSVIEPAVPSLALGTDALAKRGEEGKARAVQAGQPALGEWFASELPALRLTDLQVLSRALTSVVRHSSRLYAALAEEVDILWWLYSERSKVADEAWTQVAAPAPCLLVPYELAQLTQFPVGHEASRSFLAKALAIAAVQTPPVSIVDAVNSAPDKWRTDQRCEIALSGPALQLLPISMAIERRAEAPDDRAWVSTTEHVAQLKLSESRPALDVAEHYFFELMLLKLVAADKNRED
jgi:hypothetical protein